MKIATLFVGASVETIVLTALQEGGMRPAGFRGIAALIGALRQEPFDAVVLEDSEEELPNWLAMLQLHSTSQLPRIVVGTGLGAGLSRALHHGAHDYALLSDGAADVVARVRAHVQLRRRTLSETQLKVRDYSLDACSLVLKKGGREISLTAREFALAWTLFVNQGRVVTVDTLSARVWGRSSEVCKRTIEQHIYKLRRKLIADPRSGPRIQAVYGVGYRLELEREMA
ncbi:response regulator transcription factor [Aquabacterium sp. A7-Y]|uniref:response regulator transcription factor n=1 Tax=Aquabacterium sp. A7-Y TaxID=1349605 RepID=UPI00223DC7BC|nr:response regulator transcription factor [Aquabacterium sp. A7-Y]MCW7540272.1 response regulator transcription factor [Aquabacterium sp. A7-Y]